CRRERAADTFERRNVRNVGLRVCRRRRPAHQAKALGALCPQRHNCRTGNRCQYQPRKAARDPRECSRDQAGRYERTGPQGSYREPFRLRRLTIDFSMHGEKAIAKVRRTQPAAYLKILALLVPREHKVEHGNPLKEMTTEQIERGIELIKEMIAKRDAAANAKVIEGEAMPSLPAPTAVNAKSS